MKELEERILNDGIILPGDILMVGSFLNQQVDPLLLKHMAIEVKNLFKEEVTKVLTIEASGIPFATAIAMEYEVPMVFAKKNKTANLNGDLITASVDSYTHKDTSIIQVNKDYLNENDRVLIVDDFLAKGNALKGLIEICNKCKARVVGCAIEIEKEFQNGGNELRDKGYRIESLAKIKEFKDGIIKF